MGINSNPSNTKRSEQNVLVNSFDEDFNVLAFENLDFNPAGQSASASLDRTVTSSLTVRTAVKSDNSNITYVGEARAGEATSNQVWRIQRIDETSGVIVLWADGDVLFDNEWDERENLTYS